ncbi:MAG: PepSY domain-containing protein [archaeon]
MRKLLILMMLGIFCVSFVFAADGSGSQQVQVQSENAGEGNVIQAQNRTQEGNMVQTQTRTQAEVMTQARTQEVTQERNKLKVQSQSQECPDNCTCSGSVTKCQLQEGREMTVRAGNSGNIIIQSKGINAETKVELYQSDGKVYGVFKNNQTKNINILPDQVKDRVRAGVGVSVEDEVIELDEDGVYQIQAKKRAKLFGLFSIKERVRMEVDSETGEVMRVRNSWWGFLAKDEDDQLVGGCGTVTPGMNDECCQNQGYNSWKSGTAKCE